MAREESSRAVPFKQLIGIPLNVLLFLLLMVMGWGSWAGFFAHPVRVGVVVIHLLMMPVMTLCTAGRSKGTKHAPDWRPFFPLLMFHSLFTAWVMPYMDAREMWVLPGGDAHHYAGNDENPVFTFDLPVGGAAVRLACTGMYSLDRSVFKYVAPDATNRRLVPLTRTASLAPDAEPVTTR